MGPDFETERWIQHAADLLDRGLPQAAIDPLRRALTVDPDQPRAHALLALALLRLKRVGSAMIEAHAAVALAPDSSLSHEVYGHALLAERRYDDARQHFDSARALDPFRVGPLRGLAALEKLDGRVEAARALLEQALELDPDDADTHVALGHAWLARGGLDEAEKSARTALEIEPESVEALILMGWVALRRGDIPRAHEHAVWALQNAAGERHPLTLLVAIKARQSLLLGAWFRLNEALTDLGPSAMIVLVAAYMGQRFANLVLQDVGLPGVAEIVGWSWTALCVYSWIAPQVFKRMLDKELRTVRLDPKF